MKAIMGYVPLNTDISRWPYVERFTQHTLEGLFFKDVHAMLRLPMKEKGIGAGCNFAVTHTLLAAVAGVSTSLYRPGKIDPYGGPFVGVLVDYYPWELEANPPKTVREKRRIAKVLYEEFRGPLIHHLGVPVERTSTGSAVVDRGYVVKIERRTRPNGNGFYESELELLERSESWPFPHFFGQTLQERSDAKLLKVERFYWGIRRMVERLAKDSNRMGSAEAFLKKAKKGRP